MTSQINEIKQNWAVRSFAAVVGLTLSFSVSCAKGSKSATRTSANNGHHEITELHNPYMVKQKINLSFADYTWGVGVESKAFLITEAVNAGLPESTIKEKLLEGWDQDYFVMQANGALTGNKCLAGLYREDCVGVVTEMIYNNFVYPSVSYTTPNMPASKIAVATRYAQNKIEYFQVETMSNEEFEKSGIEPLDSSFRVIPTLFDNNGNQIIIAGENFSLALRVVGIPNTESGKEFSFFVKTENVDDEVDGEIVKVPGGQDGSNIECDFYDELCLIPGGPFKVRKPTALTFTARPTNETLPVKPVSLTVPVINRSDSN